MELKGAKIVDFTEKNLQKGIEIEAELLLEQIKKVPEREQKGLLESLIQKIENQGGEKAFL